MCLLIVLPALIVVYVDASVLELHGEDSHIQIADGWGATLTAEGLVTPPPPSVPPRALPPSAPPVPLRWYALRERR